MGNFARMSPDHWKRAGLLLLALAFFSVFLYWFLTSHMQDFALDWHVAFYPAAQRLLHGQNPYDQGGFYNPVWTLLPMLPFVMLGERLGGIAWFVFNIFTYLYVGYRMRAKPLALAAFLLSPLVIYELNLGNVDALVLWGLICPAPLGLVFTLMKPQVGIATAAYLAYVSWREHGWGGLARTFLPVVVLLALNLLIFGLPQPDIVGIYWNVSFFPWTIPVGLALFALAIRIRRLAISLSAGPFFSPYLSMGSWSVVLVGMLRNELLMMAVVVAVWTAYAFIRVVSG